MLFLLQQQSVCCEPQHGHKLGANHLSQGKRGTRVLAISRYVRSEGPISGVLRGFSTAAVSSGQQRFFQLQPVVGELMKSQICRITGLVCQDFNPKSFC